MSSLVEKGAELVLNLFGGNKQAKAAEEMARLQKEAEKKQYLYDVDVYQQAKQTAIDNRAHAIKEIELKFKNEGKIADHKDSINQSSYNYNMQSLSLIHI